MTDKKFDGHFCVVDKKDGKTELRFWDRNHKDTTGDFRIVLKLTDKERLELIHILSE